MNSFMYFSNFLHRVYKYEFRVAVLDASNSTSFSGFHHENISISTTVLLDFFNLLTWSYHLSKKDDIKPKIPQASDLGNTVA